MSPQRHTQIFLCSAAEQIAQCVLAINVSCIYVKKKLTSLKQCKDDVMMSVH